MVGSGVEERRGGKNFDNHGELDEVTLHIQIIDWGLCRHQREILAALRLSQELAAQLGGDEGRAVRGLGAAVSRGEQGASRMRIPTRVSFV